VIEVLRCHQDRVVLLTSAHVALLACTSKPQDKAVTYKSKWTLRLHDVQNVRGSILITDSVSMLKVFMLLCTHMATNQYMNSCKSRYMDAISKVLTVWDTKHSFLQLSCGVYMQIINLKQPHSSLAGSLEHCVLYLQAMKTRCRSQFSMSTSTAFHSWESTMSHCTSTFAAAPLRYSTL